MEIKGIENDKAIIAINLYDVKCPYCGALLKPSRDKKLCECRVISYRLTDKPVEEKNRKTYPLINGKGAELHCIPSKSYIEFEIMKKVPDSVTIMIDERVFPSSEKLRKILSLDWNKILQILKEDIKVKKAKKTLLYTANLNFEQRINLLKLKNARALENVYNKFILKEVK